MATITQHTVHTRVGIQKVGAIMGIGFLVVGVAGIIMPGFLGMHLSLAHNIIHLGSGSLALWAAYNGDPKKAYTFSLAFGVIYTLLGVIGFVIGQPGYPAVGHMDSDQNLLRVIPNILEFGTNDHSVHIFLGAVMLGSAFVWKRRHTSVQGRTNRPFARNSETDLADAELGRSDVNRPSDLKRRSDFERRI